MFNVTIFFLYFTHSTTNGLVSSYRSIFCDYRMKLPMARSKTRKRYLARVSTSESKTHRLNFSYCGGGK
jgi:hypothetical protein